jgi:hypothetical protein
LTSNNIFFISRYFEFHSSHASKFFSKHDIPPHFTRYYSTLFFVLKPFTSLQHLIRRHFFFLMKSPRWTFSFSRTNPKWLSGESSTLREISYCFHLLTRILRRFCACRNEFLKAPGSSPSCCCSNLIVSRTSFSSK